MCSCHSILECCIMFSGVKLSMGSFVLLLSLEAVRDATRIGHCIELDEMEIEVEMAIEIIVGLSRKIERQEDVEKIEDAQKWP